MHTDGPEARLALTLERARALDEAFATEYGDEHDSTDDETPCAKCGRDAALVDDLCPACNAIVDLDYAQAPMGGRRGNEARDNLERWS